MALREVRRKKLLDLMERRDLGAVVMGRLPNFAWYTGGSDNRVDHSDSLGVASVVVTREAAYVLANNIEAGRMREEEVPGLEVVEYPWHENPSSAIEELTGGKSMGADHLLEGAVEVSGEIAPLRYVLDTDAIERYRRLGADASAAISEAESLLKPEMGEHEAAALLGAAYRKRGLITPVLLATGEERMPRYRHPIPRSGKLGGWAMLVVCSERGGLYANLTRMVYFEEPDKESARRQEMCEVIMKKMRGATTVNRGLSGIFEDCKKFYTEAGFSEEWKLHHQGGLTGYASRELVATSETNVDIQIGMAFAWNPSVTGAKAEETFILTDSGARVVAS